MAVKRRSKSRAVNSGRKEAVWVPPEFLQRVKLVKRALQAACRRKGTPKRVGMWKVFELALNQSNIEQRLGLKDSDDGKK